MKETETRVAGWLHSQGMPVERRQTDRRHQPLDPLADVWKGVRDATDGPGAKGWDVRYQGQGRWRFEIKADQKNPHVNLREIFKGLSASLKAPASKKKR